MTTLKELPEVRQRGVCCGLPEVDAAWAASTADPRGLQKADPGATDRIAACWFGKDPIVRLVIGAENFVKSLEAKAAAIKAAF